RYSKTVRRLPVQSWCGQFAKPLPGAIASSTPPQYSPSQGPADGVFPEKVNEGREYNGKKDRKIGDNPNPATIKFGGKRTFEV
ncbi:MAG: photosystem I reaction center subunit II, partial [Cyanobacteria bacterium P01_D01_bin.128]